MYNSKKVSAIITTHNRVDLLGRAINSVLKQTYENMELIVVSDGSTDGTDDFMKKLADSEKIVYISYSPSKGGNYARNQGILHATGEYVAFLDDDDEWLPQKIEMQMAEINKDSDVGLVYVGKKIIYVNQNIQYDSIPSLPSNTAQAILVNNFIGTTSCVLAKRKIVLDCGMFDETLKALQDFDLWIRICQKCKVKSVSEPLINYYNYLNTTQVSSKTDLYENSIQYIETKYNDLYKELSESLLLKHKYEMYLLLAQKCTRNGQGSKCRDYLRKAYNIKKGCRPILFSILSFLPFYVNLYLRNIMSR